MTEPEFIHINPIITGFLREEDHGRLLDVGSGSPEAIQLLKACNSDGLPGDYAILIQEVPRAVPNPMDVADTVPIVLGYVSLGPTKFFGKVVDSPEEIEFLDLPPLDRSIAILAERQTRQINVAKALGDSLPDALMSGYDGRID